MTNQYDKLIEIYIINYINGEELLHDYINENKKCNDIIKMMSKFNNCEYDIVSEYKITNNTIIADIYKFQEYDNNSISLFVIVKSSILNRFADTFCQNFDIQQKDNIQYVADIIMNNVPINSEMLIYLSDLFVKMILEDKKYCIQLLNKFYVIDYYKNIFSYNNFTKTINDLMINIFDLALENNDNNISKILITYGMLFNYNVISYMCIIFIINQMIHPQVNTNINIEFKIQNLYYLIKIIGYKMEQQSYSKKYLDGVFKLLDVIKNNNIFSQSTNQKIKNLNIFRQHNWKNQY